MHCAHDSAGHAVVYSEKLLQKLIFGFMEASLEECFVGGFFFFFPKQAAISHK